MTFSVVEWCCLQCTLRAKECELYNNDQTTFVVTKYTAAVEIVQELPVFGIIDQEIRPISESIQ